MQCDQKDRNNLFETDLGAHFAFGPAYGACDTSPALLPNPRHGDRGELNRFHDICIIYELLLRRCGVKSVTAHGNAVLLRSRIPRRTVTTVGELR